jgi:HK97 family phage prohead protease
MNQPTGQLEYRTATQTAVNFAKRIVELIVMPYETETVVEHRGRMVREVVSRGAFDGIERRANRVRVNRDHDITRTVGRALSFYPARDEGLVAELRIAQTELGDETLALADEGILDASAGFLPMPDGETWPDPNLRRLDKLWLAHVAMTPDPAYETARVLSVRSHALPEAPGAVVAATPNLDRIRASVLEDMYSRLSH